MPFVGFHCEAQQPEPPTVAADQCLACARRGARPGCDLTAPVVTGLVRGLRGPGFGLTITTLLGCARKHRLQETEPYLLKPSELWWAYRGQLMHTVAAAYARDDPGALAERRFSLVVAGAVISGQPDLVLVDRRHLIDFKTTANVPGPWRVWTCPTTGRLLREGAFALRQTHLPCPHCAEGRHPAKACLTEHPPRPYARHEQQVSLYRLLLWENGLEVDTAEIVYQDMRRQRRLPATLLPLADAHSLLTERVRQHQSPTLPPILTAPEDLWECDYCPVRAACEREHGQASGK